MIETNSRHDTSRAPETNLSHQNLMLSKVPEVTIYFWIIKVLCTTVGETASDFMNVNLGLGLTGTSVAMGLCLLVVFFLQFRANEYIPGIYWFAVVLISVFGTLITDILTDNLGVPLEASTVAFSIALGLNFAIWYAKDRTLSIHSIVTRRRESFYWLTILFTFALGTAAGDLMAESLGLGYLLTGIIVCASIATITIAWRFGLDAVLAFWIAYILTRPLGASLGDYLSQSQANGGLGFGASITTAVFTLAILAVVIFLTVTRRDFIARPSTTAVTEGNRSVVAWQVVVVLAVLVLVAGTGYHWRSSNLRHQAAAAVSASPTAPLGKLSAFRQIAEDALGLVRAGDLSGAQSRVGDLEFAWDNAEARLRPMDPDKWSTVDHSIDDVLRKHRAVHQDAAACRASLESLITLIDTLDNRGTNPPAAAVVANTSATETFGARPVSGPLGDLAPFIEIAQGALQLVEAGDIGGAKLRIKDLETAWDNAEPRLKPMNAESWIAVDRAIDRALTQLRSGTPDKTACAASLKALIAKCQSLQQERR